MKKKNKDFACKFSDKGFDVDNVRDVLELERGILI